ncbi:MAG: hypothetical protein ABIP75_03760 [Pyrinomonadaceae bacterium]
MIFAVMIWVVIISLELVGSEFFVVGAFRIFVYFFPADFVVMLGFCIYWRERRKRR